MAVTFVTAGSTAYTGNSATRVMTLPAGTQAGDVFHVQITARAGVTVTGTSGASVLFTQSSFEPYVNVLLWTATSAGAGSVTFTISTSSPGAVAWAQYRGVDGTTPILAALASGSSVAESWTAPALTLTAPGCIIGGGSIPSGSRDMVALSAGWTDRVQAAERRGYLADYGNHAAGVTPTAAFNANPSNYMGGVAYQLALNPAAGDPDPEPVDTEWHVFEGGALHPLEVLGRATPAGIEAGTLAPFDLPPVAVDYGRDLTTWMQQPGGQTLTLPPGTYTMSSPNGIVKANQLWLVAQHPGTVVVESPMNGVNFAGIGFAGIHFARALNIATATTGTDTERVVFWHCELTNGDAFHTSTHHTPLTLFHEVRGPVYVMGCDIHNAQHDGIKANPSDATGDGMVHIQGCRIWDLHGYTGMDYHCDAVQVEKGRVTILDTVTGLDADGDPSPTGHIMTDNAQGSTGTFLDMRRMWITASHNYGIHWDRKQPAVPFDVTARDINLWANQYPGIYTAGSPTIDQSGVIEAAPTGTAPDVAWRENNPYDSLSSWAATAPGITL